MARFSLAVGTATIAQRTLGARNAGGEDEVTSCVFQIWNVAGGFSTIPNLLVEGSGQAGVNVHYVNMATGDVQDAGTAITAAGIFAVFAPGCQVQLTTSAGTATCEALRVVGVTTVYHKQTGN